MAVLVEILENYLEYKAVRNLLIIRTQSTKYYLQCRDLFIVLSRTDFIDRRSAVVIIPEMQDSSGMTSFCR